jgi:hypothetical protein
VAPLAAPLAAPIGWVPPAVQCHMADLAKDTMGLLKPALFETDGIKQLVQQMSEPQQHRFLDLLGRVALKQSVADPRAFVTGWAHDFLKAQNSSLRP